MILYNIDIILFRYMRIFTLLQIMDNLSLRAIGNWKKFWKIYYFIKFKYTITIFRFLLIININI